MFCAEYCREFAQFGVTGLKTGVLSQVSFTSLERYRISHSIFKYNRTK